MSNDYIYLLSTVQCTVKYYTHMCICTCNIRLTDAFIGCHIQCVGRA